MDGTWPLGGMALLCTQVFLALNRRKGPGRGVRTQSSGSGWVITKEFLLEVGWEQEGAVRGGPKLFRAEPPKPTLPGCEQAPSTGPALCPPGGALLLWLPPPRPTACPGPQLSLLPGSSPPPTSPVLSAPPSLSEDRAGKTPRGP